ncbi:MAG TPA: hypothetical protein VFL42_03265 [Terriglobales bacterium]|nr:hypothetical protein [Terriglobales bacterium]
MTIFGFNTDVKHGAVVYHVQSEARQADLLLQTLVFVKGQCVGKRAVSYAQKLSQPGFSSEAMHELLKSQHREVIQALEQGRHDSVLGSAPEIEDVGGSGLSMKWSAGAEDNPSVLVLQFQVLDSGQPAAGAELSVRPLEPADARAIASATTDGAGAATLRVELGPELLSDSAVMAQAICNGKSATRKVRFKR